MKNLNFGAIPGVTSCKFKKGEYLVQNGEYPNYVYEIISGSVKRVMLTDKGDEIIMERFMPGDLAGLIMATTNIVSASNIIAEKDCCCYKIPKSYFIDELDASAEIIQIVVKRLLKNYKNLKIMMRSRQEGRMANYICTFILDHAKENREGQLILPKYCTNAEIARRVGVHAVTASRIINQLIHCGALMRTPGGLLVCEKVLLQRYAGNAACLSY